MPPDSRRTMQKNPKLYAVFRGHSTFWIRKTLYYLHSVEENGNGVFAVET